MREAMGEHYGRWAVDVFLVDASINSASAPAALLLPDSLR
jgi:hypothetical protein